MSAKTATGSEKVFRQTLIICGGTACLSNQSFAVKKALEEEIKKQGLSEEIDIMTSGCQGLCETGPLLIVKPDDIFYNHLKPEDIPFLVEEHLLKGRPVKKLMFIPPAGREAVTKLSDIDFFKKQILVALRNRGLIDAEKIDDYIAQDGYRALTKVLTEMEPEDVLREVKKSGLRGRGGAGFPTGQKWEMVRAAEGDFKYLICNGDEGDPGAYMDRSIIESDPHSILEGMLIGARAMGADQGFVYIRNEYPLAVKRMNNAIQQARDYGLLGKNILGTGFDFDLNVVRGAGAFICGEETSLIASVEGKLAEPRPRPPYPAERGLWDKPTNINNVETWANIPAIILRGADWFSSIGTELSKGTKVFSVVGKVKNTGLVEVPMGMSLGEIIFDICGGMANDRDFKAVQIGGPSGGCIPAHLLNTPVDYEKLTEAGAMMGSGGMVVLDENTCMVDMAHFFLNFVRDESCGKCTPCRDGIPQMMNILKRIKTGDAEMGDLDLLEEIARTVKDTSLCGLGKTASNPVLSTLRYFKNEYVEHIKYKNCSAGVCSEIVSSPCHHTCPIETEACSYVALIAHGKFDQAAELNYRANPLASVCSRICHHPCEWKCRAGEMGDSIAVRDLKRFVTDYTHRNGGIPKIKPEPARAEKVAVVGSGPSGLMAAWELGKKGYPVTVFESESVPGGMLAWGIPEYRLPKKILNKEIEAIKDLGVEVRTGTMVGKDITLEDIKSQGYQAFYLAAGAQINNSLGIPGEDVAGVVDPLKFLKTLNITGNAEIGKKVVVVGGGNTAIDAARSAWRMGAEVTILYRRTRPEMPAISEEIDEALEEGVNIEYLALPVEAIAENGRLSGIKAVRMELREYDKSGRRRPVPIPGSEFEMEVDTLIPAIGQSPDLNFLNGGSGLNLSKWKTVEINPETMETNVPGIFAGGDVVTGAATVLGAMRAGKIAADSIHRYVNGLPQERDYKPTETSLEVPPVEFGEDDEIPMERPQMPKINGSERAGNFREVELGLAEDMAVNEAKRCLRCDLQTRK